MFSTIRNMPGLVKNELILIVCLSFYFYFKYYKHIFSPYKRKLRIEKKKNKNHPYLVKKTELVFLNFCPCLVR